MSRDRVRLSDDELITRGRYLEDIAHHPGWHVVVGMLANKRRVALEALANVDPANVVQVARLQAQVQESDALLALVDEAIRRGKQAYERVTRERGGDD